jgi:hypothetical protein
MIRLKKNDIALLVLLLPCMAYSQFRFKCGIDTPDTSGFYSISITPQLSSHLKTDLTDIRVVDNKGQWVPHIIRTASSDSIPTETKIDLNIVSIEHHSRESIIIVANQDKRLLNNFILRLKNAATERMISLSGSDDNQKWFIISDSILLAEPVGNSKDENVKEIHFPSIEYRFLKLIIRNSGKDPLNLLAVGARIEGPYTSINRAENPSPTIKQVDSAKWSFIEVHNNEPYQINQLSFDVRQPALFDRIARLYLQKKDGIVRMWESYPFSEIRISRTASSGQTLPLVQAKEFYIIISNEDNPPLEIVSIKSFQPARELVTYLEKGKTYELLLDDRNATAPNYDLQEFAGKIPVQPQALRTGQLAIVAQTAVAAGEKINKWWIWVAIASVIIVLGYLTLQLTKDMNRTKEVS